jgi:lantibiotic modifying enzyme
MSWQPLLQDALKDRALESVQAIVDDLACWRLVPAGDPSLASGTAGLALLYGYLAQTQGAPDHAATAVRLLQQATAAVADKPTAASLYGGLAGVGWALAHLRGRLPGLDAEDDLADMDEVLLDHLGQSPWRDDYDLISGLVGFGVYALERLPGPLAAACLGRVLDRLAETAEHSLEGCTWRTSPALIHPEDRGMFPRGYYNLGLAHGVPGVIALLGRACAAISPPIPRGSGEGGETARALQEGAVQWLLARQGTGGFAAWLEPEKGADRPAPLGWCYGDPGVAAALLGAARCVGEPDWEREAGATARRAARRPFAETGVVDAGLCHGAAGLGHLFNRLFQATGEPGLAEAARFWFDRALALRRPGQGIGGYSAWAPGDNGAWTWVADPGLLTGAAGIALALLAATTSLEPCWDRMMLVDIRPEDGPAE